MGTRNATIVIVDKQIKIYQYCQWDGYPMGKGVEICAFIQKDMKLDKLRERVRELKVLSQADMDALHLNELSEEEWAKYPQYNRDTGPDILKLVQEGKVTELCLYQPEEKDIWIEWTYILDLDTETLRIYDGVYDQPPNRIPLKTLAFKNATPKEMKKLDDLLNQEEDVLTE